MSPSNSGRADAFRAGMNTEEATAMTDLTHTSWTRILDCDLFSNATPAADAAEEGVGHDGTAGARVPLQAADGYRLVATRFPPTGTTRATLVVAGAIGVSQRFYRHFARFAAAAGYATTTFDYRGIGLSAPSSLRGFRMDYADWGRYDLAAAIAASSRPGIPLHVVGHSFGGHAFGFLPNHRAVTAFYTFGTGSGWHGWMPPLERIKVLAMWRLLGPLLTRKGYLSWSALGLGEDLPLDFYRQWRRWCTYPRYFFDDPDMRHDLSGFARIRAPLMAANSIDDPWTPPKSRDAFMAGYRNAQRQVLDLDPRQAGLTTIGHMGYFKRNAARLWSAALAWLDTCQPAPAEQHTTRDTRDFPAAA